MTISSRVASSAGSTGNRVLLSSRCPDIWSEQLHLDIGEYIGKFNHGVENLKWLDPRRNLGTQLDFEISFILMSGIKKSLEIL